MQNLLTSAPMIRQTGAFAFKPYTYVPVPDDDWRRAALGLGFPPYLVHALVDLQRYQRLGHCTRTAPAVEQLTGSPPTPFRRFVEDHAEAFR